MVLRRVRAYRGSTLLLVALAVVGTLLLVPLGGPLLGTGGRAHAAEAERCSRFAWQSAARERIVTGHGPRIAVLGDSYSVGLGLTRPGRSWPSRLPGRTEVFGFSGSGFARDASPCPGSWFGHRVIRAAAAARTVVVEGGLNDFDQPAAAIRKGFRRVLAALHGRRVLVVGPTPAPARAAEVPRVDAILAAECRRAGVPYLSMARMRLPYLTDDLHLTVAGHRAFGTVVAERVRRLG